MEVYTFLSHCDFSNKVIIPFSTHEGSGFGNSISEIQKLVPNAIIKTGIAIRGSDDKNAKQAIATWLNN